MLIGCAPALVVEPSLTGLPPDIRIDQHEWYTTAHHTGRGFENVHNGAPKPSRLRIVTWVLSRVFAPKDSDPPPAVTIGAEAIESRPEHIRATWIGHGTVYVQTPDLDFLIDPVFSERVSPFSWVGQSRRVPLTTELDDLPRLDAVLISHDHYDHLDQLTVEALVERFNPVFFVPLGLGPYVRSWGAERVAELDWWQFVEMGGYRFTCAPAQHNSGRRLAGGDRTLWAGWYVEPLDSEARPGLRVFYGGDTGYGTQFDAVREVLGEPDLAILPVGAYAPRWMMAAKHVNPEEAVQAFTDLRGDAPSPHGRNMLAMHWGTFALADEPLREPGRRTLAAADSAGLSERVQVLPIGGAIEIASDGALFRIAGPVESVPSAGGVDVPPTLPTTEMEGARDRGRRLRMLVER
ncbi:MBL fold metallo-hydrolase [soil metagenome]